MRMGLIKGAGQKANDAKNSPTMHGSKAERQLLGKLGPYRQHGKPTPKNPGKAGKK